MSTNTTGCYSPKLQADQASGGGNSRGLNVDHYHKCDTSQCDVTLGWDNRMDGTSML